MNKKRRLHILKLFWVNACRAILAAAFIFSGFVKAIDPLGTVYKFGDYLTAIGLTGVLPRRLLLVGAVLLAGVEFCVGAFLLLGIRRKLSTALALLMMVVMTPLTLWLALENPVHDCGCFGDAWVLTNWQTFGKNVVLLVAAVSALAGRGLIVRFLTLRVEWIVTLYVIFFIFALSLFCLHRLPVLDFRPYRVGTDLRRATDLSQGELPAIQDFWVEDRVTGRDLTDSLLAHPGYTFILIAHRVEEADDGHIDLINEVCDYCALHGYGFVGLTASDQDDIDLWTEKTGAEYPFLWADDITLKTIIRANPGLLLLHDGRIYNKWNCSHMPDEYDLTDELERIDVGRPATRTHLQAMGGVLLWFAVPLLIVLIFDLVFKEKLHEGIKRVQEAVQRPGREQKADHTDNPTP